MPFTASGISVSRQICRNFLEIDEVLKGLCLSGRLPEALEILCHKGSQFQPHTYSLLLQECINLKDFNRGRRIHAHMITVGFSPKQYLVTKMIILYAKYGDLGSAHYLFDNILEPSLVSWNAMITGYVQKGLDEEAVNLYYHMRRVGLRPDQFTFASVFRACASLATLEQGKIVHGVMIKTQIKGNVIVNSALVDMYFKCSSPDDGRRVFDILSERNVVTWTALISGYGRHGRVKEVLDHFHQMIKEGFMPNYITFVAVLSACSHGGLIVEGKRYFSSMMRDYNIVPRGEHIAAMVDLLGRTGKLAEAYEFAKKFPCRNHSTIWGALLGACRMHGDIELGKIAAKRFFELEQENAGKYVVLSNAFASFGLWENVQEVREMMRKSGLRKEPGSSWIEIQRDVHCFIIGDKSHEQTKEMHEMLKELGLVMKDAGYIPEIKFL